MSDVAVFEAGPVTTWVDHSFTIPGTGLTRPGAQFLGPRLGLQGGEISVNVFLPGQATPFSHRHKANEEVYVFLSGSGEMLLDGKIIPLTEGTCVRCAPRVARAWRNTGTTPMMFVVVQYPLREDAPTGIQDGELADDPWPT